MSKTPYNIGIAQKMFDTTCSAFCKSIRSSQCQNVQQVLEYFEGKIEAVIDGGQCNIGTESTVIDLSGNGLKILRLGALSEEELE